MDNSAFVIVYILHHFEIAYNKYTHQIKQEWPLVTPISKPVSVHVIEEKSGLSYYTKPFMIYAISH
jgi:hypothetical protein